MSLLIPLHQDIFTRNQETFPKEAILEVSRCSLPRWRGCFLAGRPTVRDPSPCRRQGQQPRPPAADWATSGARRGGNVLGPAAGGGVHPSGGRGLHQHKFH